MSLNYSCVDCGHEQEYTKDDKDLGEPYQITVPDRRSENGEKEITVFKCPECGSENWNEESLRKVTSSINKVINSA